MAEAEEDGKKASIDLTREERIENRENATNSFGVETLDLLEKEDNLVLTELTRS